MNEREVSWKGDLMNETRPSQLTDPAASTNRAAYLMEAEGAWLLNRPSERGPLKRRCS